MNYPFAYVLANERIIINEDTIFTDSSGRYQYLVFYNHLRDAKISLRWTSFNPNDVPIVISVRKQRIVLKSEWQKMEKYRRKDKLPVSYFNILVERSDSNYKIMNEIK
jgi:hypothetical protein